MADYEFHDLKPAQSDDDNELPVEAVSVNGEKLDELVDGYMTLNVKGRESWEKEVTTATNGRNGLVQMGQRIKERTLVVSFFLTADTPEEFNTRFRKLSSILNSESSVVQFEDEQDQYRYGVVTALDQPSEGVIDTVANFTLTLYDPFLHSAPKTLSYTTSSGTSNIPVTDDSIFIAEQQPNTITLVMTTTGSDVTISNSNNPNAKIYLIGSQIPANSTVVVDFKTGAVTVDGKITWGALGMNSNIGNFFIANGDTVQINNTNISKFEMEYEVLSL